VGGEGDRGAVELPLAAYVPRFTCHYSWPMYPGGQLSQLEPLLAWPTVIAVTVFTVFLDFTLFF